MAVRVVDINWIISYTMSSCQEFDKHSLAFVGSICRVVVGANTKAITIADGSDCGHANDSGNNESGKAGKHLLATK